MSETPTNSFKLVIMTKQLLTEVGWARREIIWLLIMVGGPYCTLRLHSDLEPNVFLCGPSTQSINSDAHTLISLTDSTGGPDNLFEI